MAGKREKPEEIVSKLRQVEVLQGQGATIAEGVRQIGVTQQTFYRWRKLYITPRGEVCELNQPLLGGYLNRRLS